MALNVSVVASAAVVGAVLAVVIAAFAFLVCYRRYFSRNRILRAHAVPISNGKANTGDEGIITQSLPDGFRVAQSNPMSHRVLRPQSASRVQEPAADSGGSGAAIIDVLGPALGTALPASRRALRVGGASQRSTFAASPVSSNR